MEELRIPNIEFSPFMILEGQLYLNGTEEFIEELCIKSKIKHIVLTGLYDEPEQIKQIDTFKPKSIVLGTTGVYHESLKKILDVFATCKHLPDNIFVTMGEEVLCGVIRKYKEIKPSMKVYKVFLPFKEENSVIAEEIEWI